MGFNGWRERLGEHCFCLCRSFCFHVLRPFGWALEILVADQETACQIMHFWIYLFLSAAVAIGRIVSTFSRDPGGGLPNHVSVVLLFIFRLLRSGINAVRYLIRLGGSRTLSICDSDLISKPERPCMTNFQVFRSGYTESFQGCIIFAPDFLIFQSTRCCILVF